MAKRGEATSLGAGGSDNETLLTIARLIRDGQAPVPPDRSEESARTGTAASRPDLLVRLLDALPVGVLLAEGSETLMVNHTFALAFGYNNPGQVLAAGGLDAVFPSGAEAIADSARGAGSNGYRLQLDGRSRSGRSLAKTLTVHALEDRDGNALRVLVLGPGEMQAVSGTAVAEAKPAETESEPATAESVQAQIGEAAEDRTDFLAKVSHEVRTPLNSIIGFSELMKEERLGPIGNDRYRSYIRDIHESGLYALSLINDLLDISKIASGNFEINFTSVDLDELADDCLHVMQPQAQAVRVVLRVAMEGPLPRVLADARAMKQVLLNLLSNAIKFTGAGGQVIVSARVLETGDVRLRVRDTGIGMSGSEIEQAMRPFRQLDTSPRKQVGTGLGLPLTKALVEANRARFSLKSHSGEGTTIDITFSPERTVASVSPASGQGPSA